MGWHRLAGRGLAVAPPQFYQAGSDAVAGGCRVALGLNAAGDLIGEDGLAPYGETFYCAQMVFAVASATVLFGLFRKTTERRDKIVHLLLALNLALLLAYAFSAAYGFGSAAGERHDAMKGIVILLALSWEIAISGELTNYATRSFPRNSRVLLFLGYVMLVAFGVLTMFPTTYRINPESAGFRLGAVGPARDPDAGGSLSHGDILLTHSPPVMA